MIRVFMILLVLTGSAVLGADRFQVCEEIVIDTATGFQWTAAPDRHMEWADAVEWVAGLGEEWRLPLMDELAGLFEAGVTDLDWGAFEDYGRMDAWSFEKQ